MQIYVRPSLLADRVVQRDGVVNDGIILQVLLIQLVIHEVREFLWLLALLSSHQCWELFYGGVYIL